VASVREETIPTERPPLVGEVRANFCVVSTLDIQGRILGFLDRGRYFFFKVAFSCTYEAEWTPFQTHYFSENVVGPGIEPVRLDLYVASQSVSIVRSRTKATEFVRFYHEIIHIFLNVAYP
jgi:hypothetical protein